MCSITVMEGTKEKRSFILDENRISAENSRLFRWERISETVTTVTSTFYRAILTLDATKYCGARHNIFPFWFFFAHGSFAFFIYYTDDFSELYSDSGKKGTV